MLPNKFQSLRRRLKCEKLTEDGRQVMAKAHIAFGLWQGELKIVNLKRFNFKFGILIFHSD